MVANELKVQVTGDVMIFSVQLRKRSGIRMVKQIEVKKSEAHSVAYSLGVILGHKPEDLPSLEK